MNSSRSVVVTRSARAKSLPPKHLGIEHEIGNVALGAHRRERAWNANDDGALASQERLQPNHFQFAERHLSQRHVWRPIPDIIGRHQTLPGEPAIAIGFPNS